MYLPKAPEILLVRPNRFCMLAVVSRQQAKQIPTYIDISLILLQKSVSLVHRQTTPNRESKGSHRVL